MTKLLSARAQHGSRRTRKPSLFSIVPPRSGLTLVRRNAMDRRGEAPVRRALHRPVLHLAARRILAEKVAVLPVPRRPDRSRHEAAAAVRANVTEDHLHAARAKGALVAADPCLQRVGRQRLVAMLASRAQFQHG